MIAMRPCTDPAALAYFSRQLNLPQGDLCYIAVDMDARLLGAAVFTTTGGVALLQKLAFADGPDAALADGLLRASLNYAELQLGCPRYCISPVEPLGDTLARLGYQVGEDTSIALFFQQSGHCGHGESSEKSR